MIIRRKNFSSVLVAVVLAVTSFGQITAPSKAERGSLTAKNGFKNETEIAGKFNDWQNDAEARIWLSFMGYKPSDILAVSATKPHGEKADIQVKVTTKSDERSEGISIKLVSSPNGFNQIDKRWLSHYVKMWSIPPDVEAALKLYVGEAKPNRTSRNPERMYIDEFDPDVQKRIADFFTLHKAEIVSDLFMGDGEYSAGWLMVALKSAPQPRWVLRSIDHVIKFYGDGPVEITRNGNLKLGRITMQRKGGDGGRETARMLQFKINPALLFDDK